MDVARKNVIFFLEAIDIFSYPLSFLFTFKGKFRYSTVSTKVMTLFVGAFTFASFFYFAQNYLSKTNPQSVVTEDYNINPGEVFMDVNSFFVTFALENKNNKYKPFIDKGIYKVAAYLETRINESTIPTEVSVSQCSANNIPYNNTVLRSYFIQNHFDDMYCFDNYSQIFMNGTWGSQIFNDIRIDLRPCDNITDNNTCKSQDEINQMIDGGYLVMHYTSHKTNLNNFDTPLVVFANELFQPTTLKFPTDVYAFFSKINVQTDVGTFQESLVYSNGIVLDSSIFTLYNNKNSSAFLRIFLRLNPNIKTTSRKYDNLLDVLSKVGGLMRILTVFGAVFLKPFLEAAMLQRVSNETFDYEEYYKDEPIAMSERSRSRKVKLSLWEYIKSKLKKKSELSHKSRILIQSVKIMKENLDVSYLINKLFDLEKLKFILFKDKEYELIKDKKPKIVLDESNFKKQHFQTEIEKKFQRKFCIGRESFFQQNLTSSKEKDSPIPTRDIPQPAEASVFKHLTMDQINENKDESLKPSIFAFEVESQRKDDSEKRFSEFEGRKISEESLEKGINCSKIPDLLSRKNVTNDLVGNDNNPENEDA